MAYTITLKTQTGGKFRYKVGTGSWSSYSTSTTGVAVDVPNGQSITFEAIPTSTSYYFVDWKYVSGGNEIHAVYPYQYTYTPTGSGTRVACFTTSYKTIKTVVNPANTATIRVGGPFAEQAMPTAGVKVGVGARCVLYATPVSGYYFKRWNNADGTQASKLYNYGFVVSTDRTLTAVTTNSYKTIKASVNNTTYGNTIRVRGPFPEQDMPAAGIKVGDDATVYLTATPKTSSYYFVNWTEGTTTEEASALYDYAFNVDSDRTLKANFTATGYRITATVNSTTMGSVKVSGPFASMTMPDDGVMIGKGATCVLTADANDGYTFTNWREVNSSGTIVSYYAIYRFNVTQSINHYASFTTVWEGTLENGVTYTLTTPNTDQSFKVTCSNTSSPYHNKTYQYFGDLVVPANANVNIVLNNSKTIRVKRTFVVQSNGKLTLTAANGADRTLQRFYFNGTMFRATEAGASLTFGNASSNNRVIIDGGANFKNKQDNTMWDARGWNLADGHGRLIGSHRGVGRMIQCNGNLIMNKVTLQGSFNDGTNPDNIGYRIGSAIHCQNTSSTAYVFAFKDVIIQGCYGSAGAAIYFQTGDWHKGASTSYATMENVTISGCYSDGDEVTEGISPGNGTIRTNGSVRTSLKIKNSVLKNNQARLCGGAITWNASGTSETTLYLEDTEMFGNEGSSGGAINTSSSVVFTRVNIHHNKATTGGGICVTTYGSANPNGTGEDNFNGEAVTVEVAEGTYIHDNEATNYGGGIMYSIRKSDDIGFKPNGDPLDVSFDVKVTGGKVYNNKASLGGGIAIVDIAARKHKNVDPLLNNGEPNPAFGKWSGVYNRSFTITAGEIYGNEIIAGPGGKLGGGVYIQKSKDAEIEEGMWGYTYATSQLGHPSSGEIAIKLSGGKIYENKAEYYVASEPSQGRGGGLAVQNYIYTGDNLPSGYESICNTLVEKTVEIYDNTSHGNGGGIYINGGNFSMTGGIVGKEGHPNKTVAGHGGAVFVADGNFSVSSSSTYPSKLYYNEAHRDHENGGFGGAFYVNQGTCTISGGNTEIMYNKAVDRAGGGFYVNLGNVEISNAKVEQNTANTSGGGLYVASGSVTLKNAYIRYNKSLTSDGGGLFVSTGSAYCYGAKINYNEAKYDGGGIYVNEGNAEVQYYTYNLSSGAHTYYAYTPQLNHNKAERSGGGLYAAHGNVIIRGAQINNNTAVTNGGGVGVSQGDVTIESHVYTETDNSPSPNEVHTYMPQIKNNTTNERGGGVYVGTGNLTFTDGNIESNEAATGMGGGIYVASGTMEVSGNSTVALNKAYNRGGGACVGGGTFTMTGGIIGGTTANGNKTTGNTSYGGGLYMAGGTATISGGTISGNATDAEGYGGGIYMNGGTCTLSGGSTIGGEPSGTLSYANSAKHGGGIYSANGTITVKGGKIQYNTATAGGGIYTNGAEGVVNMEKQTSKAETLSYIEHNTAQEGGGIYANRGTVNFSDGYIQYNHASNAGGGIYVNRSGSDYGILNLKGSANLSYNSVPTGHDGGGVYLKGRIVVGEAGASGRIMAQTNYSGDAYSYTWEDHGNPTDSIDHILTNNRNNVYLPDPEVRDDHTDVIEIIEDGISLASHVGFSVEHGYVPVIYCDSSATSRDYLHQFSTGQAYQYNVFDDTRRYIAVQYSNQPDVFDPDHVYLYGFWSNEVTGDPEQDYCEVNTAIFNNNPIPITTPCELAYFISWVNGLNNVEAHPNANAILMADIDMSEFGWVPIGKSDAGYGGTFDGNGHTVSGLVGLLYREYTDYGFFGKLKEGAEVKDLFVNGANFYLEENGSPMVVGGLAGEINSNVSISNTEVASKIYVENTGSVSGGLVGRMKAGTVHSAIGISDMTGYLMGGLVGELLGGSLYNSFSNVKFASPTLHDRYMGGLAAVNRGTVENCYARLRGTAPANFGSLVGDNTGGTVRYAYAPQPTSQYTVSGKEGTLEGVGTYGATQLPYLYAHRDTQVSATNAYVPTEANADKQMLKALEAWVEAKNDALGEPKYTTWGRPWQESETNKPLNEDYPILRMPMAEAVASSANDPYLEYNDIDVLLASRQAADEAIWMYNNSESVTGDNSASSAKLYIAEDVALLNDNALKAYVGVTLDNSAGTNGANPTYGSFVGVTTDATDWHMISK